MRGVIRSGKAISFVRWALDVEKAPIRSLGAIAASLVFVIVFLFSLIRIFGWMIGKMTQG